MHEIHDAHDHFFKNVMSDIRIARDFFEHYLPIEIKELIELDTLHLESGSYIDPALKSCTSDILYSVQMGNEISYFYLLCEHQSSIDKLMPLRDLEYKIGIWRDHLKQQKTKSNAQRLPLILTFIFYNGRTKYDGPLNLKDIMEGPKFLINKFHEQPFVLIDANEIEDEVLRQQHWFGIVAYFMKHIRKRNLMNYIEASWSWLLEIAIQPNTSDLIKSLLIYPIIKGHSDEVEKLLRFVRYNSSKPGDEVMSAIAEKFLEIFEDEVNEKFKDKIELAKLNENQIMLTSLLKLKFGFVPSSYQSLITNASISQIKNWSNKLLFAGSLQDVFEEKQTIKF